MKKKERGFFFLRQKVEKTNNFEGKIIDHYNQSLDLPLALSAYEDAKHRTNLVGSSCHASLLWHTGGKKTYVTSKNPSQHDIIKENYVIDKTLFPN